MLSLQKKSTDIPRFGYTPNSLPPETPDLPPPRLPPRSTAARWTGTSRTNPLPLKHRPCCWPRSPGCCVPVARCPVGPGNHCSCLHTAGPQHGSRRSAAGRRFPGKPPVDFLAAATAATSAALPTSPFCIQIADIKSQRHHRNDNYPDEQGPYRRQK